MLRSILRTLCVLFKVSYKHNQVNEVGELP
jgi:hypothetical protein